MLCDTVIEKDARTFFKRNTGADFFFKTKIKIIAAFFFEMFVERRAFDEKIPGAYRKKAAMGGIDEIIFGCKVGGADIERAAFFKNAMEVFKYGNIVNMLKHVLGKDFIEFSIAKRKREFFDVMHDVNAGYFDRVEVDPPLFDVDSAP